MCRSAGRENNPPAPKHASDAVVFWSDVKKKLLGLIAEDAEFEEVVSSSLNVIRKALEMFAPLALAISFNGGKDACVVLYLLMLVLAENGQLHQLTLPTASIKAVYFRQHQEFPAITDFLAETEARFQIPVRRLDASYKEGMQQLVDAEGVKAVFMGQRRGDPWTDQLEDFSHSTEGWPDFTRVNPVLGWKYRHVWKFLRGCGLPYCGLYDQGYTSLGEAIDTLRNPALARVDGTYRPAYELDQEELERSNRAPSQVVPPSSTADTGGFADALPSAEEFIEVAAVCTVGDTCQSKSHLDSVPALSARRDGWSLTVGSALAAACIGSCLLLGFRCT